MNNTKAIHSHVFSQFLHQTEVNVMKGWFCSYSGGMENQFGECRKKNTPNFPLIFFFRATVTHFAGVYENIFIQSCHNIYRTNVGIKYQHFHKTRYPVCISSLCTYTLRTCSYEFFHIFLWNHLLGYVYALRCM